MGLYAIKFSVEVSAVLRSECTKYGPMLSVCDLLVTFHCVEYMFFVLKLWKQCTLKPGHQRGLTEKKCNDG